MKAHSAIIIKNKDNQILFIKRSMAKKTLPGAWSFPSGTLEEDENVEEATIRESSEELGVEVEIDKILAEKELSEFNVKLVFVLCSIKEGEPSIMEPDEIAEIKWMKFNEFFERFRDDEIGHGLIWLRKNPEIWSDVGNNNL